MRLSSSLVYTSFKRCVSRITNIFNMLSFYYINISLIGQVRFRWFWSDWGRKMSSGAARARNSMCRWDDQRTLRNYCGALLVFDSLPITPIISYPICPTIQTHIFELVTDAWTRSVVIISVEGNGRSKLRQEQRPPVFLLQGPRQARLHDTPLRRRDQGGRGHSRLACCCCARSYRRRIWSWGRWRRKLGRSDKWYWLV